MTRTTELNKLVANLTVLYTKLHSFHWYVKGRSFYTLHEVFENYYNHTTESLDEVAERLLAIGGRPVSTLKGAVNAGLPKEMKDLKPEEKEAFLKTLGDNKDKKIVIYCGFVACERSHVGAVLAKEAGYKNVYRFPGGIAAWLDAGNSIDK